MIRLPRVAHMCATSRITSRETLKPLVTSQSWVWGGGGTRGTYSSRLKAGTFTSIRMFVLDGVLQNLPRFGVDADLVFHILSANDEQVAQPASSRFLLKLLRDGLSLVRLEGELALWFEFAVERDLT